MKTNTRLYVILGAAALVLLGGVWAMRGGGAAVPVQKTAQVVRGDIAQTVLAAGAIEAKQLVSVGARVSGQIESVAVTLGQVVAAGDVIAQIDKQDQQNDLLRAEASLAGIAAQIAAKTAGLRKAELIMARQDKLGAQDLVSQEAVEGSAADVAALKADLSALTAQKSSAEVTVAQAKIGLERTTITAPIDGTVVAIVALAGQTVNASSNAPTIVKLANLNSMLIKAEISEADVVNVRAGQKASFTILGAPDLRFDATVRAVEPAPAQIKDSDTVDTEKAIYYIGLLEVANPNGTLRIGMTAQVSIVLAEAKDALLVPASALRQTASGYEVTRADATVQAVTVGLNDKVNAQITAGLKAGDAVVTGTVVAADAASSTRRGGPPGMGL